MTIFESLKLQGFSVAQKLPTKGFILLMSNLPTYKALFPDVFSMIDTLQAYFDRYNSAVDALKKAQDFVQECEDGLLKAKDMYNKILNTPAAYTSPGGLTPKPIIPTATITSYAAIETAQQVLDKAKQALAEAEAKVNSLNTQVENYKDKIVNKLMTTKV